MKGESRGDGKNLVRKSESPKVRKIKKITDKI